MVENSENQRKLERKSCIEHQSGNIFFISHLYLPFLVYRWKFLYFIALIDKH